MRIILAPDKFKGTLSAMEVCEAMESGLLQHNKKFVIKKIPLADGGEGSLDIIQPYLALQSQSIPVKDPLGRPIMATYMYSNDAAYIEMSAASGISLLKDEERNCLLTSTYGTGQLVSDAFDRGLKRIFLFVGGSATNDGGMGILKALGIKAFGKNGTLSPVGKSLPDITGFDYSDCLTPGIQFTIVSDVMNPLYGPTGAAYVYAPQKGASKETVKLLDEGLRNMARVVWESRKVKIDEFEGAGAAGGIAAGLKAFFPVMIKSGVKFISEIVKLQSEISAADLVITGEGKFDLQTLQGKVVKGVYDICLNNNKRLAVVCGLLDPEVKLEGLNIWKIVSLVQPGITIEHAMGNAHNLVRQRTFELLS
ncbi:MAG: glycerate kinase [Cyclobacteriaceae bacterium]|nr:MAG: glycerate kinase [Cyclobacteriaceae bacterium]